MKRKLLRLICECLLISLVSCTKPEDSYPDDLDVKVKDIVETILSDRNCKEDMDIIDKRLAKEVEQLRNRVTSLESQLVQKNSTIIDLQQTVNSPQNVGVTVSSTDMLNDNVSSTKDNIITTKSDTVDISRPVSVDKLVSQGRRIRRAAVSNVAFSAYLSTTNAHTIVGQAIKFDQVLLNDGKGYNNYTGAFIAPLSGVYMFTFHFDARKSTFVRLVVNGVNQVDAVANAHTNVDIRHTESMGGNTAIVHVGHSEAVLVETYEIPDGETASSNTFRMCTFSGVLLY